MSPRLPQLLPLAALVLTGALESQAATDPLQVFRSVELPGGLASAATCIQNADPADGGPNGGRLELRDLPPGATVQEAFLYWTVLSPTSPVETGAPALDGVTLDVVPLGELALTPCFPQSHTAAFRADVTALVDANGDYALGGFPGTPDVGVPEDLTEGATLFVLYCAPGSPDRGIVLLDGLDVVKDASTTFVQAIDGFEAGGVAPVAAVLHAAAGNGQSRGPGMDDPDPFLFNGVDLDATHPEILSGSSCLPVGLYDHTRLDVTGLVEPSATSATVEIREAGDCYSIAALALVVDTVPGLATPEPSALDRDPTATPLTVRRLPAGLQLAWEDLGAGYHAYRGSLSALWATGRHDHAAFGACDLDLPEVVVAEEPGDHYFLVVATGCGGAESTTGRDSLGRPRPGGDCR